MPDTQDRQEKIFRLIMDIGIGVLLFLLPLKFGLPFIPSQQLVLPVNTGDWMLFCWPNEIVLAAVFTLTFVWLAYRIMRGQLVFERSVMNIPLFVFLVFSVASAVSTTDRFRTAQSLLLTFGYAACFLLFSNNIRRERVRPFLLVLLSATAVVVLCGLHQHFIGLAETRQWVNEHMDLSRYPERFSWRLASDRVFATFVYPNALGGYLAMLVLPASAFIVLVRDRTAYAAPALSAAFFAAAALFVGAQSEHLLPAFGFAVAWPLCMWAVFALTYSNGAFAALLASGLCSSLASRKKLVPTLIFAAVACGAVLVAVFPDRFLPLVKVASVKARIEYWKAGLQMVLDRPFLGSGPGSFGALYSRYMLPGAEETQLAHNAYMQAWIESGTAAFVAYALFWAMPFFQALRRIRTSAQGWRQKALPLALAAGLGAFVFHNAVDFDHFIPGITITALALAVICRLETEGEEDTRPFVLNLRPRLMRYAALAFVSAVACALVLACASHCYSSYLQVGAGRAAAARKMDTARTMAAAATAYNPFNSTAHYLLGSLYEAERDFENARRAYERAVAASPNIAAYRYSLGRVMLATGHIDPRRGILELMHAVQAYPANERYRKDLDACLKNYDINLASLEEGQAPAAED